MSFKDMLNSVKETLHQGPVRDAAGKNSVGNLPNGGSTGYHPKADDDTVRRGRKKPARQKDYQSPLQNMNTAYTAAPGGYPPPAGYGATGYSAAPNMGYNGMAGGYPPVQPQMQTPPVYQGMNQTGYQPGMQTGYQPGSAAVVPEQPPVQEQQNPQGDNISYLHTNYVDKDGSGYRHIERVVQPVSLAMCYHIIEYMRNRETVVVNVEAIEDERDQQRCLDLLFGASFTMDYVFTRIASRSVYLITPAEVQVLSCDPIREMSERDVAARWRGFGQEPDRRRRAHGEYPQFDGYAGRR